MHRRVRVESGGSETVGAGLGSRDCEATGLGATIGAATADVLTDAATGFPSDASGCDAPIAVRAKSDCGGLLGETRAFRSIGRSSGLATLPSAGCGMSFSVAPASLEVATVKLLRGCIVVGPCVVSIRGDAFGGPGSTPLSQKIEPTTATLTRTSAEALNLLAPTRRPVAKSIWFGSFE